jgi:trimethylamine:corrinoid methyltransferase-like protein
VLTLAINNVAQKEEAAMKMLLELGVRNTQSIACEVWSLHFQD